MGFFFLLTFLILTCVVCEHIRHLGKVSKRMDLYQKLSSLTLRLKKISEVRKCHKYLLPWWQKDLDTLRHWTYIVPDHWIITETFVDNFCLEEYLAFDRSLNNLWRTMFFSPLNSRWANSSHKSIILGFCLSCLKVIPISKMLAL